MVALKTNGYHASVALAGNPHPRQTILVVEDHLDLSRIFRDSLLVAGFDAQEANDGPAALRMIEASPPDLVVLDVGLPTLDGASVRKEIAAHAETQHIPVVIVTGTAVSPDLFPGDLVLRKPVGPGELVAAVRSRLAS